jgi:hypothetical protein
MPLVEGSITTARGFDKLLSRYTCTWGAAVYTTEGDYLSLEETTPLYCCGFRVAEGTPNALIRC